MSDINLPPQEPSLDELKANADRLFAERVAYVESLTPPWTKEEGETVKDLDSLALGALAHYYEVRRTQEK